MVPGSAPGSTSREGDLTTSSAEQRTRTFDVVPAARSGIAGPAPGDVLKNRFVLHQCLADGSTSRLFRALDRRREAAGEPDPWVVLKVVTAPPGPGNGEREPRALQALRREAAIAQGLEHPNLPRILGIDHEGPHTFVCMSWIEGESLAAILDSRGTRPMTRVQALHILEGVGRALVHLHSQGITHADVKPGNILVTAQGDATLLDFGVALGPGAGDLPAIRGFTPEYASPEVLAGGEPTPSDDLFSLACVAYRMLGGHRAFGAVTAREAAAAGSRPVCPGNLSAAQWRALDRALSFARAERQPDVVTFLAQLKGARDESLAVTDLPAPELDTSPARTTAAAPGSGWAPRAAGTLALAIAGIVGAWWLQRAPDPVPPPVAAERLPEPQPAPVELQAVEPDPVPAENVVPPPAGIQEPPLAAAQDPVPAPRAGPATAPVAPAPAAQAEPRRPPAEPAGPPLPEPATSASPSPAEAPSAPSTGIEPAATSTAGRTVPFSSLTVRRYVEPAYPRNAASRRMAGWVDVGFTVEPSGRTSDARVIGADPPGIFDEAALAAVRRWRFAAPDIASGPVTTEIRVRFEPR
jgi:TonB family protein